MLGIYFQSKPTLRDFLILAIFSLLVIWNPFYLIQNLNLFELGLYLPGISSILDGQIPYRDFFHLRGPFELYLPALMMKLFGENVAVLSTYFYVGNVLCLLICLLIAYRLFPQRWILYSFIPVLIARTYPRVVYTYWGGFRYVWGLLAIYCLVEFLLQKKRSWILAAGFLTALAGLTSIEVGVCSGCAIIVSILIADKRIQTLMMYLIGIATLLIPYFVYLSMNGALNDYFASQWMVATQMTKTYLQTEPVPSNIGEVLAGLLNPANKNFRQMTPVYCYLFYVIYWLRQRKAKQLTVIDQVILGIAVYGFTLYVTGFRNLWASVFEMSLQPEKIVLFYLIFKIIEMNSARLNRKMINVLIAAVVLSSIGYSFDRFNKRFLFFRKKPFQNEEMTRMSLPRLHGMILPAVQADDLNQLAQFINEHTKPGDKIWMYPELGALHFILDRPFADKYPIVNMTWMDDREYLRYMTGLWLDVPKFAVVNREMPAYFEQSYFPVEGNRKKHKEQLDYLNKNYTIVFTTPTYNVYKHN